MYKWLENKFTYKYKIKIKELNKVIDILNTASEAKDAEINRLGLALDVYTQRCINDDGMYELRKNKFNPYPHG